MAADIEKRAFDVRIFSVDVGPAMRASDTIASVTSVAEDSTTDLTIDNVVHSAATISFRIAGGTPGKVYDLMIRFVTTGEPTQMIETVLQLLITYE